MEKNQFLSGFAAFGGGRYQCPGRYSSHSVGVASWLGLCGFSHSVGVASCLILWVWLPSHFVGVASFSFCGCGFLSHSVGVTSCLILWVWLPVCQYCLSPSQVVCTNGDSAVYSRCVAYV